MNIACNEYKSHKKVIKISPKIRKKELKPKHLLIYQALKLKTEWN
jgi:hypothetical protein